MAAPSTPAPAVVRRLALTSKAFDSSAGTDRRKVASMQIDPGALAASIGELHDLDLERGLPVTLQQVVMAAKTVFGADADDRLGPGRQC